MEHRHILPGFEDTVPAVEDVLDRGSVDDWRELARRVVDDPDGPAARSLQVVLDNVPMYGTTALWRHFLEEVRAEQRAASV